MNDYTSLYPFAHGHARQLMCLIREPNCRPKEGEYSLPEVEVFRKFIKIDSWCVDGGALFGAHTVAMAELCPSGRVYAFEPQRIPYQILCGNVQLNSLPNVWCYNEALHSYNGEAHMPELDPHHTAYWGMNKVLVKFNCAEESLVKVSTLDSLEADLKRLDFIKLDVEGCEPEVLEGAANLVERFRPVIYLEFTANEDRIVYILRNYGYYLWKHDLSSQPGTPMLLATWEPCDSKWLDKMEFHRI